MADRYTILQLQRTDETARERFMNLDWLREQGLKPNPEHYEPVYSGELEPGWRYPLEELFAKFNWAIPADFTGHSMSVSDVVAIQTEGIATKYYYCDSFGFELLPTFHHAEVEGVRAEP